MLVTCDCDGHVTLEESILLYRCLSIMVGRTVNCCHANGWMDQAAFWNGVILGQVYIVTKRQMTEMRSKLPDADVSALIFLKCNDMSCV